MNRQQKRALGYVGAFVGLVAVYTLAYNWGMAVFEGRDQTLLHSLEIVVQTFTTTGYGEDAPWGTAQMNLLMVAMQFTGVLLLFTTLPLFVVPWMEDRLRPSVPTRFDGTEHVVVCSYTSRGEALRQELESWDREYVFVESDRELVEELREGDVPVVHGDPESPDTLANAGVGDAEVVVADATDEINASVVLAAEEVAPDVRTVSFVEDAAVVDYLRLAGADEVFSPRRLLGRSLAQKVTTAVTTELGETVDLGRDFEIVELSIQRGCPVCDTTLAESGIRERTGASIIGAWSRGEFQGSPDPDTYLDEDTILLVAGSTDQLERLKELTLSEERRLTGDTVVVAGLGEVGSTVVRTLSDESVEATVVDRDELPDVDVVGDVRERTTLRAAGVGDAGAVILALGDDTATVFATLVIRELDPTVQIVARANEAENVGKIYRAGADYVLALETISGRMLASTILDEEVMSFDRQVEIVRTAAPMLAGRTLREADVRSKTGSTVIAVERDGRVITDLEPGFRFERDDALVVAGTDEAVNRFNEFAK
jgi:Trk K+ transport system NAD-binding subunit